MALPSWQRTCCPRTAYRVMVFSHKIIEAGGVQLKEYIQNNVALYQFRNGIPLTTGAAANFTRRARHCPAKEPTRGKHLDGWFRKGGGASLYYVNYIASLHKVEKGELGHIYFAPSLLDRHYHSGMSVVEAVDSIDKYIVKVRSRLVIAPPNFVIKIVDKDGAREQRRTELGAREVQLTF